METRIKDMRIDHGLTQEEVAKALGITQRKYRCLEAGIQDWDCEHLVMLAEFYHTSVDYLIKLTDKPPPNWRNE